MKLLVLAAAPLLMAQSAPAPAPDQPVTQPFGPLTMAQRTALDCGVAFGLAVVARRDGVTTYEAATSSYPHLETRGREFFVRSVAQVMDDAGLDREAVKVLVLDTTDRLGADPARVNAMLPGCLLLLDASGL